MKKLLITTAVIMSSHITLAESNSIYFDVLGGVNFGDQIFAYENSQKTDDSVHLGKSASFHLGTGFYLTDNINLGARYSYRRTNNNTTTPEYSVNSKFHSHALLAEVAYHFTNDSNFTPYVKTGLGVSSNYYDAYLNHVNSGFPSGKKVSLAWGVGAGVDYKINKNISLIAEYQYSDLGEVSTNKQLSPGGTLDHAGTKNYRISEVNLGLRIKF